MPIRVFARFRALYLPALVAAVLATLAVSNASQAQVSRASDAASIPADALAPSSLELVLREGHRLEEADRWGEALSHYEEALRAFPEDPSLAQRHDVAKLHYCIDRRYCDRSFLQSLESLAPQQAQSMYLAMLRRIDADYVDAPPWQRLALRGVAALDLALADDAFQAANRLSIHPERLGGLRSDLYALGSRRPVRNAEELASFAAEAARLADQRLGLRPTAAILEFVTSSIGGLDDYSSYLTASQFRDVHAQIEGNFVGLGVELKADAGALLIVHVIPGSPAERAGIRDGDRIIAVDGRTTAELSTDEAAALLTGEEGSYVRVTKVADGAPPATLLVRRENVTVPSLEGVRIADPDYGVAYVKLPAFQKTTARDLEAALWDLHRQGMRSLILDLRGNPGGLLTASVEVADKFLKQGRIVSTRGRNIQEKADFDANYGGTWQVPLVVMIDRDSASASEIFAGAIKENKRGEVVGERSYGKGSVQGIFPLGYAGAGIRLTTALFYSPSGQKISKLGVTPNVIAQTVARSPEGGEIATGDIHASGDIRATGDNALESALSVARRRSVARSAASAQGAGGVSASVSSSR